MHVLNAPGIGRRLCHAQASSRLFAVGLRESTSAKITLSITFVTSARLKAIGQGIAGIEKRLGAGTAGILPLGLGGQALGPAFLLRKPVAVLHRLLP
jgi:hypothetical protein